MQMQEITIDDSNEYSERFIDGESAGKKAEYSARNYIANIK